MDVQKGPSALFPGSCVPWLGTGLPRTMGRPQSSVVFSSLEEEMECPPGGPWVYRPLEDGRGAQGVPWVYRPFLDRSWFLGRFS